MHNQYQNCYRDFPEYYDLLYQRYLKSIPTFVELVSSHTPSERAILDLAAGTGEVSIPLIENGYEVTSLDGSQGMLEQLRQKAETKGLRADTTVQRLESLSLDSHYDTVCIRQAINYYMGMKALTGGLRQIATVLKPTGTFIFNAPNFLENAKKYEDSEHRYEEGSKKAVVLERNLLEDRVLTHQQDAMIWSDSEPVIHLKEENVFYMFTKEEFEQALTEAGFSQITFLSSNGEPYQKDDKTIYCIAQI
ncbi:MAG: dTDP-3-amino-3,6-dideoxy-alpha-D-glucopyranose N,N-dimethyltransferase [Microgenomates bacterium OLB22]|nr:MAG: dTDP-3-amino-3,6-dideoxy-alpha-D-glucopyranose N,N-dimethyltransferase [Microgenomates bacterium OLB22]